MKEADLLGLLKEIAGTKTYDTKRKESKRIMQETDGRRDAIEEVLEFIENRLGELGAEKEELQQFQKLDNDRRSLEYTIYDKERNATVEALADIENNRDEAVEGTKDLHQNVEDTRAERIRVEEGLKTASLDCVTLENSLRHQQEQIGALLKSRAKLELQVKDMEESQKGSDKDRASAAKELMELEQSIKETNEQLDSLKADYKATLAEEEKAKEAINSTEHRLSELYAKQGRSAQFSSKKERDAFLKGEVKEAKASLKAEKTNITKIGKEIKAAEQNIERHQKTVDTQTEQLDKAKEEMDAVAEESQKLKDQRDEANNQRKDAWREESELDKQHQQLQNTLRKAEGRLKSMMDKQMYKGIEAVRNIVKENDISGYYGPLIELFECDDKARKAVETTAGNALFHIVVDNDETAAKLIGLLNREKAGRITCTPLAQLQDRQYTYPKTSDAFPMIERIKFKPMFARAMKQVFGKTVIVRNLEVGSTISRTHNLNAITLDGDQVNKKGALTGGFIDNSRSRILAQREIIAARAEFEAIDEKRDQVKEEMLARDQTVTHCMGEIQKLQAKRAHIRNQLQQWKTDVDMAKKNKRIAEANLDKLEKQLKVAEGSQKQIEERIEALEDELRSDLLDQLDEDEQKELHELNTSLTNLKNSLPEASAKRAAVESEMKGVENLLEANLNKRYAELQDVSNAAANDDMAESLEQARSELQDSNEKIDALNEQIKTAQTELDRAKNKVRTLQNSLDAVKAAEVEAERQLSSETQDMERILNRRALLVQKKEDCMRKIRDLGSLPSGFERYSKKSTSELMKLLEKANSKLKKFSHVNKKAIDQFVNFTEKRDELLSRVDETNEGRSRIDELIIHLDNKKDEAIQRTFKTIAKNFTSVFSQLVPGGKGTLVIRTKKDGEDEEEQKQGDKNNKRLKLATNRYKGVGIKVSFAGEESQDMRLLSGGQQTVVALSLIFAIQRCDPSPFYLFDEIDSNLDAVYRTSVAEMISRMSSETQFITTTFRNEMLTSADKFYGVSFENKTSEIRVIDRAEAEQIMQMVEQEAQ